MSFNKSINKGIPSDIEITLPFADVLNYSNNPIEQGKILTDALGEYMKKVGLEIDESLLLFGTNRLMSITTDPDTLDKKYIFQKDY